MDNKDNLRIMSAVIDNLFEEALSLTRQLLFREIMTVAVQSETQRRLESYKRIYQMHEHKIKSEE